MSLFNELKRRNVFRVAIAYGVVSWLLIQVADVMIDNIGAPNWLFGGILLVLAVGFPLALVFAWAFEMTPEGLKREQDVDRTASIAPQTGRKLDRVIIGVLVLGMAWLAWDRLATPPPQQASTDTVASEASIDKSIAVLPFVNMSGNEENEYFSDGLSEELLNLLAKVSGLKVAARTSSFRYKDADADIAEIGQALNVATVLEGSVRRAGNQARITAQLIKVDDGFHLWSETYDRELDNIFAVQDEIANAIVDALKLPLLGQDNTPLRSETASSFEAYDLYLLGLHSQKQRNETNLKTALEYFRRATELDPGYVPAWAGLSRAYALLQDYGGLDYDEAMGQAKAAADRAIELDPRSPDALNAQGWVLNYRWAEHRAAQKFEQALEIDPNNFEAQQGLLMTLDPTSGSRIYELAQRAWDLDPLNEMARKRLVEATNTTIGLREAEDMARSMLRTDPESSALYEGLGEIYRSRVMLPESIDAFERTWELRPGDVYPAWRITEMLLRVGDVESARTWAAKARGRGGVDSRWAQRAEGLVMIFEEDYESFLDLFRDEMATDNVQPSFDRISYGEVLLEMGRSDAAEQQFRAAMTLINPEPGPWNEFVQPIVGAYLAAILPEGEERDQLIRHLDDYASRMADALPWNHNSHVQKALSAAMKGQRDSLLAELDAAMNAGWVDVSTLERHPAFRDWQDDPMFREAVLRMNQRAATVREALAAEGSDV